MSVNEELLPLRNKIDGLDSELVRLLNERAEVAKEIGEIKARAGLPVYRPEREAEVLRKICGKNEGPLPNESLVAIWREVMCACRGLESELKVAYLGPRGTFSEQAMIVSSAPVWSECPLAVSKRSLERLSPVMPPTVLFR